jgi:NADH-quinone oxidoreductase subunit M
LWMYQRVVFGNVTNPLNRNLLDLSKREIAVLVPVLIFIVWIGVYPNTFLKQSAASTKQTISIVTQKTPTQLAATGKSAGQTNTQGK